MTLPFADHAVHVPPGVVARVVDESTVLLNTATGRYFTLDEVGSRAWAHLTASASIQDAFSALLGEFDVGPDRLREDLEALIGDLAAGGLVEVRRVQD